jgi:hypothetical protein
MDQFLKEIVANDQPQDDHTDDELYKQNLAAYSPMTYPPRLATFLVQENRKIT